MDGTLTIREMGKRNRKRPNALPLAVDLTRGQADGIVTRVGRLMYDGRTMWSWALPSSTNPAYQEFLSAAEAVGIDAIYEAQAVLRAQGLMP